MASANTTPSPVLPPADLSSSAAATTTDDVAAKAVNKRYEGLMMVRNKAVKGKGAWYWAHLEPILIKNPDTNLSKAVKLRCCLCDAVFSASNPSRTASEHLKRGTCPNFTAVLRPPNHSLSPLPLSSLPSPSVHVNNNCMIDNNNSNSNRKRSKNHTGNSSHHHHHHHHHVDNSNSLAIVESTRVCYEQTQPHLVLSGGKEDLGALAMLENSVKKLKSPKTRPGPVLSKDQVDSAVELLADWFYDSCGSVSFSSLDHPKFRAFLNQVGLPVLSRREVLDARLDNKFLEAKTESEARIREAMFFQVASDGWKIRTCCAEDNLVKFTVNLPNGTSVYQKAVITGDSVSSKLAEDILWETVMGICGTGVQRCVGIVADKYKAKALRNLEIQNQWMVNLSCQLQGFFSLLKDFSTELPVFRTITENCLKIANFVNNKPQIRNSLRKHKMLDLEYVGLIRVPSNKCDCKNNFVPLFAMLEDIWSSARVLQMVVLDDSCKVSCVEDPIAREVVGMIQSEVFWNELEAVYSLAKLIKGMTQEIEAERPLIGQCLPLWEELRSKVKNWCAKFTIPEGTVEKIVEKRFRKNYHPAWSAAFILDPLYLIRDNSGKYLPPFKCLTEEQEKDVDKLITRLVSREEAHFALMELMKWRSEGLDPLYAQAVQVKQRDPITGKMRIANPQSSRLVWETCLSEYKSLGKVAVRLIFLHATSCGFKFNWSFMKSFCVHRQSRAGLERAQKMIFVAAHAKLEKRDFSNEEEKDAELFATSGCEDDMLNEVFADASSMMGLLERVG
ncbi:Ribonuclease H-like domain containing protein [Melia azedarach]|uniref:Ribonuclease H-like domain containing protein n=1 Tax=Melia azedarach TaxID=155640 RepID=A0ACC1X486_MELAZ|nr:Ribonuclease H-like domain containing protein [Melia azedarach]